MLYHQTYKTYSDRTLGIQGSYLSLRQVLDITLGFQHDVIQTDISPVYSGARRQPPSQSLAFDEKPSPSERKQTTF